MLRWPNAPNEAQILRHRAGRDLRPHTTLPASGEDALHPLFRHGVASVHGPEQCSADRAVRVGVAAALHGSDHPFLERRGVEEFVEGVLEGGQHPPHLPAVVWWSPRLGLIDAFPDTAGSG